MVELTSLPLLPQFRAIVQVRWRMLRHGLRTTSGRVDAASHLLVGFGFGGLAMLGAAGFGLGGWYFVRQSEPERLALLLWPLCLFWLWFPLTTTAFSDQPDSRPLARFPLSFRGWFLVHVVFGALDPASLVGLACCTGLAVGCAIARPALLPVALAAAILFAAFNILLSQTLFAWLEHWLARRRSRELLALIFFALVIGVNFIAPLARAWRSWSGGAHVMASWGLEIAAALPPSLPGQSVAQAAAGRHLAATGTLILLGGFTVFVLGLLRRRLSAEYRGEIVVEAESARAQRKDRHHAVEPRRGGSPESAILAKELRYLLHSPVIFFSLAIPVFVPVFLHFNRGATPGAHAPGLAYGFPIAAGYALLTFTNFIFNACGSDAAGVQLYFLAPVQFRQVLAAKNRAYAYLLGAETVVLYLATWWIDGSPSAFVMSATLIGLVFAAFCAFAIGNLTSILLPKKIELGRLGRQASRGATSLLSLLAQGMAIAMVVAIAAAGVVLHRPWLGLLLLALLALAAAIAYGRSLDACNTLALDRRESLIAALSKP